MYNVHDGFQANVCTCTNVQKNVQKMYKKTMDFLRIELGRKRTSVCSGGSDRALILLGSVSDSVTGHEDYAYNFILLVFSDITRQRITT